MKKINQLIQKFIKSKYLCYILILFLTIIIMAPIFTMDLTRNNDYKIHLSRILGIDCSIKEGNIPPIIDVEFMNGFGYALNLFYGPLTTYIPIILFNILGKVGLALKVFTFITVFLSGIAMYKFAFKVSGRRNISTITALIYISIPYKLSNIYDRAAVGEYTAFIFIPIVFLGIYNILNEEKNDFWLCIGVVGLVLSHTITTVYTALFAILYLLLNFSKLKKWKIWKKFIINIFIAFLICCFFAIPLLEHFFSVDYAIFDKGLMNTTSNDVYDSAIGLQDLFDNEIGNQDVRFSIGIVTLVLILLSIICYKKIKSEYKNIYLNFAFLAIIALWMSTKYFPWFILPDTLGVIQFAWRNLGFFAFFISLVCGINAITLAENIIKNFNLKDTFLFAVVISICTFSFLGVMRNYNVGKLENEEKLEDYVLDNDRIYVYSINREYLPIKAFYNLDYIDEREDRTYILHGKGNIVSEEKDKLQDKLIIENTSDGTILELPYIYYLCYSVEVSYDNKDFEKVNTFESENGLLAISVNESASVTIKVKYELTLIEKISYLASLIGVVILIIYIYRKGRRVIKNGEDKR